MKSFLCTKYLIKYRLTLYFAIILVLIILITSRELHQSASRSVSVKSVDTSGHVQDSLARQTSHNGTTSDFKWDPDSRRQIILVTYGRSGSSLTTDIIHQSAQVYTYFEPLHDLAKSFQSQQEKYKNKNHKYLPLLSIPDYMSRAQSIVVKLMTCDYQQLPPLASTTIHMKLYDSAEMYACIKRTKKTSLQVRCLQEGQKKCLQKKIHFLKLIRFTTESVGQLMSSYPCLKMLYLIRDPRGTFFSKKRAFNNMSSNTTFEADRFCRRVAKDLEHALKLREKYPDRVGVVRYEDIADLPQASYKRMFEFLELNFTESIAEYIHNKTQTGVKDKGGIYSTSKGNSSVASYAWRSKINYEDATAFDEHCRDVYYRLGYLPVNSKKELKEKRKPLRFHKKYFL
ncbi:hypothetical protein Btru_024053 [Bulinus truncatus]|nr:hypothetical protein Btru_024053 [Bulinus truncatus]